jgi:hypothetical protein
MNFVLENWRRRALYGLALYALISVSIGAAVSASVAPELNSAPDPSTHKAAVVQVYAARTWGKKGWLAVHTWIVTKARDENFYRRHEIVGWQLRWSDNALRSSRWNNYDNPEWYGNSATLLVEHRGAGVDEMINRIEAAIETYPYKSNYRLWPGPNSNTFTAYLGKAVPELKLDLPSTAIGKNYRPLQDPIGRSASGSGMQFSVLGLVSLSLGIEEGVEANLFGFNVEWDIFDWAIELPGLGRIGYPQAPQAG